MKNLKLEAPFLILIGILWALLHRQILWGGHVFSMLDASRFFYPLWKWGAVVIGKGLIPLWNPDAGFGTPYLADPEMAVLYPPKLALYAWMKPTSAFNVLILGHHFWALMGFWVFARRKSFPRPAALLGCLIFGFSFNLVCLTWTPTTLFAYSWIPWVFWAAEGLWAGRKNHWLWFSLFWGLQLSAGYPVFAYLTYLAILMEKSLGILGGSGRFFSSAEGRGKIISFGTASLWAAASNLVWLIPFVEFSGMSNTDLRLGMPQWMDWGNLATWFNPFYLGHPLFSHLSEPFFTSVYFCGLPSLVLILWSLWNKRADGSLRILWLLVFVLSLGESFRVGAWFKLWVPDYDWVVRSGYWIPVLLFVGAWLSMEGARILLDSSPDNLGFFRLLALGVFGAALWLGVPKDLESFWFSLLFLILAVSGRMRGTWGWGLILSAAFLSQYPVVRSADFSMDRSYYDRSPDWIGRMGAPGRIYEDPDLLDRHQIISGKNIGEAYEKLKADLAPNWPLVWGLEEVCWTNTIFLRSFLPWYYAPHKVSRAAAGRIFDYLGIRYIFSEKKALGDFPEFLENPSAGPKWFSVERAVSQTDWEGDLGRIDSTGFDLSKICFAEDSGVVGLYRQRVVGERNRSVDQIGLYAKGEGGRCWFPMKQPIPGGWEL